MENIDVIDGCRNQIIVKIKTKIKTKIKAKRLLQLIELGGSSLLQANTVK